MIVPSHRLLTKVGNGTVIWKYAVGVRVGVNISDAMAVDTGGYGHRCLFAGRKRQLRF